MHNDDAVSREPPSVEKSIVFFIHAVSTQLQFSSPTSTRFPDRTWTSGETLPNQTCDSPSSTRSTSEVNLARNERRIILLRRKNLARSAGKKQKRGEKGKKEEETFVREKSVLL